jgi:hypothetical protein
MTGPVRGRDTVIANTARTLAAFPDRTLVGEAVIWSEDAPGAFLSSHRITSSATNLGPSEFGPATGRRVGFTTIADCLCRENLIVEEWLVRDNSALAFGLGLSPRRIAREQAEADRQSGVSAHWRSEAIGEVRAAPRTAFPNGPLPPSSESEAYVTEIFDRLLNHRRFGLVRQVYSPAAHWQGPGGRTLFGHGEITGWYVALVATFGDLRVRIDHVAAVEVPGGTDLAVRWSMVGRHDGSGLYGRPSLQDVYILGVTHWRIQEGLITREVTVFDEISLLRQIEGGL